MKLRLICERDARTYGFNYANYHIDPAPDILYFGSWHHPSSGNRLICGLNQNYLNSEQKSRLQSLLPEIFVAGEDFERGTRGRVRRLRDVAPDMFDLAYRTYDLKHVASVTKGRLPHITLTPAGLEYEKEKAAELGVAPPEGVPSEPAPPPAPPTPEPVVPAPEPEMPAPEMPVTGLKEPEPEEPEGPVEKTPQTGEPGAPPAPDFKPSSLQRKKLEAAMDKGANAEPGALIRPVGAPSSVQRRHLGLGRAVDWLRRGARKIGSAVSSMFRSPQK